jgi:hypothetical protein
MLKYQRSKNTRENNEIVKINKERMGIRKVTYVLMNYLRMLPVAQTVESKGTKISKS